MRKIVGEVAGERPSRGKGAFSLPGALGGGTLGNPGAGDNW